MTENPPAEGFCWTKVALGICLGTLLNEWVPTCEPYYSARWMESLKVYKIKHVYDMFKILKDQYFISGSRYSHEEPFNNERIQNRYFLSSSFLRNP